MGRNALSSGPRLHRGIAAVGAMAILLLAVTACSSSASTPVPSATPTDTPSATPSATTSAPASAVASVTPTVAPAVATAVVTAKPAPVATAKPAAPTPTPTLAPTHIVVSISSGLQLNASIKPILPVVKATPKVTTGVAAIPGTLGGSTVVPGVSVGDIVTLTTSGSYGDVFKGVSLTPQSAGCKVENSQGMFAPQLSNWAIIGRFGSDPLFCVGSGAQVTATKAGSLYLYINQPPIDTNPLNYFGAVTVNWSISHQP